MATATPEERLERLDHEIEDLKANLFDLLEQAEESADIHDSYAERFAETRKRLVELNDALHEDDYDPAALAEIRDAIIDALDAANRFDEHDRLDHVSTMLVSAEKIRHLIRDALDGHVSGVKEDAGGIMGQLNEWLPRTGSKDLAPVLNRSVRQVQRWAKDGGKPTRRLQLVARLVALLRRAWSEEGVIAWFYRQRRELGNRRPIDLLDDPEQELALLVAARQGRAQHGS